MAGGGTGGHIIPALAVARELQRRGHEPLFIGTRTGMEAKLVPAAGFAIEWIDIGGLNRVGLLQKLRTLLMLPVSILKVWLNLSRTKPGAIFSMGGYVAGPVVLAGILRGLPVVSMEPNAVPGLTNRRLAGRTAMALVNFEETARFFPEGRSEITGVPVRAEFFAIGPRSRDGRFTLLITGGSQGSRTLNEAGRASWNYFAEARVPIRIIHQAGRQGAHLADEFRASGIDGELVQFIQDMPAAFAAADLIISRAGASTVSELAAAGRPSILVPFPFAADNHQLHNAEAMRRAGAAELLTDQEMNGKRLFDEVISLMSDPEKLRAMGKAARKLAKPRAAERAAQILEGVAVR
ncbi:MAG TPA: undecaprenyldiphospho-muramoylpentapeptide beta-N-acetylglucosaminyltransferase [Bryobacteraceae bacterium]|nr:undecaprenyldiphospho-muramoylpentapeptide beta-N-acetylglucosaminyltransferase [Bryobacteraceae bacterium]